MYVYLNIKYAKCVRITWWKFIDKFKLAFRTKFTNHEFSTCRTCYYQTNFMFENRHIRDKPSLEQTSGTVYKLSCSDCDSTYIGESSRPLGKRIKEHCSQRKSSTSAVSEHLKSCNHNIQQDQVKILAKESRDFPRRVLAAIYIRQQKPNLNRDQGLDLDPVWDPIIKNF